MNWPGCVSNAILRLEKPALIGLTALLLLLILLNIVTRTAGAALFWVDELAVYVLIWIAMIGASVMVRTRSGVAVTLLTDQLPPPVRRLALRLVDAITLLLAVVLLVLCWIWYDPVALLHSGFDFDQFALDTFKFIYSEPTNTIGIRKFWVWLIVPLMAVTMTIHALANLFEGPPGDDTRGDIGL
jgi:TRAP-type C4-dicarboxylate transport system permease small subunit